MKDEWKYEADIVRALGATEYVSAVLKTAKKSYGIRNSNGALQNGGPIPADVEATSSAVRFSFVGADNRALAVVISPELLGELIVAYGAEAAKADENFPHAEAARAFTKAQTSIVNRKRSPK